MIENVALAIRQAMLDPDDDEAEHLAKAAIAAMTVQAEPVAWMYEQDGRMHTSILRVTSPRDAFAGWTETPLYAIPTPPAVGGSDAE